MGLSFRGLTQCSTLIPTLLTPPKDEFKKPYTTHQSIKSMVRQKKQAQTTGSPIQNIDGIDYFVKAMVTTY